jgi:hypothetical protein
MVTIWGWAQHQRGAVWEYWRWHCPDVELLMLIHGTDPLAAKVQHWTSIHDRTADPHVKRHALDQIKLLEDKRNEH